MHRVVAIRNRLTNAAGHQPCCPSTCTVSHYTLLGMLEPVCNFGERIYIESRSMNGADKESIRNGPLGSANADQLIRCRRPAVLAPLGGQT